MLSGPLESQIHCGVFSKILTYSYVLMTFENAVRAFAVAKGDSKGNPRKTDKSLLQRLRGSGACTLSGGLF